MPSSIIKYTKQTTDTDVTVGYTIDTLAITGNSATTGVYLTVNAPDITVANVTVTAGSSGSNQSTLTSATANAFLYIPVGATISLSVAGGAALPANSVVVSKPNAQTLIIDKEATSNSTSTGSSTIVAAVPVTNYALCKINLTLDGIGTSSYNPKVTVRYYDGSVKYAVADNTNATDTQNTSKSINMISFLQKTGVQPTNNGTLDVST